ncbi:carboxymuconolactone decarboxylase family protein [Brevundimonas sp.]|uniref:(R)-mandelonitrile lyase n=1 Tax=Brevundimonas sp. TaxID=1871086 RepID=UPI0017B181E6|nr:carboxymuconolactone decarboxylase family protein [Brevundimonas sp.]MBA4806459.1 carboxymuconolactone decarboxylase family protein [Brevundimonas sp.]
MAAYTDEVLFGQVWPGPGLTQRDRSLMVISALIAIDKPAQLRGHLGRALDNGVTPVEASGVLTHLAFYAGWPSAVISLAVFDEVYTARDVDIAALAPFAARPAPSRPTPAAEDAFAPDFARLTDTVIKDDLWRRTDLVPRDRLLVTISALTALGEADQIPGLIRQTSTAGLTRVEVGEALTHLAFYVGWPRVTRALEVLETVPEWSAAGAASTVPSGNFTGRVAVTSPFEATGDSALSGATVTFEAGARSRWHRHPHGQLLVVTSGQGWTQIEGEPVREMNSGDVIWTPPGVSHWHGGTRSSGLTHVAVSEDRDGAPVQWLEHVTDAQFVGPARPFSSNRR